MRPAPPPRGITPPTPGLEHEEPEFRREMDIPTESGRSNAPPEDSPAQRPGGERPSQEAQRE